MDSKSVALSGSIAHQRVEKSPLNWKKVICVAFTLIFAIGALASYYYDLNSLYLITASVATGVCLMATNVLSVKKKKQDLTALDENSLKDAIVETMSSSPSFEENIEALQNLIASLKNDRKQIAEVILKDCGFVPIYSAKVLEGLQWDMGTILVDYIQPFVCQVQENHTYTILGHQVPVNLLTIDMSKLFGEFNYFDSEVDVALPENLVKAVHTAIKNSLSNVSDKTLGNAVVLESRKCQLKTAMILPLMPALNKSNLVSLKLRQVGGLQSTTFKAEKDVMQLLEILASNPYLVELALKFDGIEEHHRELIEVALEKNRR